jgi:hypothetical protein
MSKRAEEKANKRWPIHPWTIFPKEGEHGEIINFDEWLDDFRLGVQSFSLNAGYKEGYEQAEKETISIIESRIAEILGDAQPNPILRAELRELIEKIKEDEK